MDGSRFQNGENGGGNCDLGVESKDSFTWLSNGMTISNRLANMCLLYPNNSRPKVISLPNEVTGSTDAHRQF